MTHKQNIIPNLWFDNNAEEAVNFYKTLFNNVKVGRTARYNKEGFEIHGRPEGSVMTIEFEIEGIKFTALNGGPVFKFTPAVSFYVYCGSENEIEKLYNKLSEDGMVMMPLDKYDWSGKYAWVQDKFGVSWQLDVDTINSQQKILPSLLFANEKFGRVKEVVGFYNSIFPNSKVIMESPYDKSANVPEGTLLFAQFSLNGFLFNAMSSNIKHDFDFNESISFIVKCTSQEDIDYYWENLSDGGDPQAQVCGWLKDKFGVSWQIVPEELFAMLQDSDNIKVERVTKEFLTMKKFDLAKLRAAFEGEN
jgi:predicted 3-demethylubiquinone-9 3-methyltransferase (glyoxalase superfamily)